MVGSGWRACRITAASAHRGAHCRGWRAGVAFPQALARHDGVTAGTQEWAGTRVEDGIKASRRVANRTVSPPASLVGGLTVWTIRAYEPAFPEGCRDTDPIKAWPGVSAAGRGRACRQRWPSWLHDGLCPCGHAAGCNPPVSSGSGRASNGAVAAAGPGASPHLVAASAAAGGMPPATAAQCLCAPPWAARGRRRIRVQQWWRGGTPARPGAKKPSRRNLP